MKFTVNKNDIVDVLSKIQGLTGRRSSLAITECIRIATSESKVHLSATDLETCFEGTFPAIVESEGTIAISARKFYEIVREFPSSDILIEEGENRWINIGNQKVQYRIMGMNADDFPMFPALENIEFFEVSSIDLKKMIDKSILVSGIGEDKKPHINGVLLERIIEAASCRLRMVSTDGSRLSKVDLNAIGDMKITGGPSVLIPKKGLHEVSKFLGSSGQVKIGIQSSYFVVKGNDEMLAIRLLEGNFPHYQDIVFRQNGHHIQIDKENFLNMLKRMSILCTDHYRAAIFTFEEDKLRINAANPDLGESKEDMSIDYRGEKIDVAFNPKFFIEALNSIDEKNVIIDIVNEEKPCLIEGVEEKSYLNAVMPMRV